MAKKPTYEELEQRVKELEKEVVDYKRAEEKVLLHREIVENMAEGVYLIRTSDGVIAYANKRFEDMFGYDSEELVNKRVSIVNAPSGKPPEEIANDIIQSLGEKGTWSGEVHNIKKDGTQFWCHANVSTFDHQDYGEVWVSVHENIDERKKAEEELRKHQEHLENIVEERTAELTKVNEQLKKEIEECKQAEERISFLGEILESSPLSVIATDRNAKIMYVNPATEKLFGYRKQELLGKDPGILNAEPDPERMQREMLDAVRQNRVWKGELLNKKKNGDLFYIGASIYQLLDEKGDFIAVVGFQEDITEHKHSEEALRESEERLKALIENAPDGIYVIDPMTGGFIDGNRKAEELVGYPREELIDKNFVEAGILPEEYIPKAIEGLEKNRQGQPTGPDEYELLRKDGSRVFVEIMSFPVARKGKVEIIGIARDICERKQIEEEKRKLKAQLQRAQTMETVGTLAGGVAHDLNNILSGIVTYPDLLLMQLPEDSPLRNPILTIQKSGEKAAAIVQDLLTLARRGVAVTEVVNLNLIISEYVKSPEHENLISFHPNVHVRTNFEADVLNILGSPAHLSKTVMNLVSNAAEAMTEGGTISISTENRYIDRPIRGYDHVEEGDYVILTVSDTGVGITSTDMERIFEPFYTKKVMGRSGTGLGMSVVWGTVKDHRGYIDIESTEGKGTTFTLYFPVTRKELAKDKYLVSIEDYMGKGESILVVDDVEEQREIASRIFKKLGYSVTTVSSGEEAVDYLKDKSADLLLLDMIMDPGIDGLETYKRIIEFHPGQKALIVSGFSETERVKEARRLGAGAYVKKPFLLEKIGLAVRAELDK